MDIPDKPRPPELHEKPLFLIVLSSEYLDYESARMMRLGKTRPEDIRDALLSKRGDT